METDFLTRLQNLDKKNQSAKIELAKLEQKQTQIETEQTNVVKEITEKGETVESLAGTVESLSSGIEKTLKENEAILN